MPELSRRQALAATALAGLVATLPAWAQDAASTTAQWDLSDLYPSVAAWDDARKKALAEVPSLTKYKGRLGESADTLAAFLVAQADRNRTISRIYT